MTVGNVYKSEPMLYVFGTNQCYNNASIGTVLSIKPMRVSEAWRFTHFLGNYWLKKTTICQEIIICKYYALWIYVMLQIMSTD